MSFIDKWGRKKWTQNQLNGIELIIIVGLACIPLLSHFPYRINIFLSWEGAYRIYQGQIPFRDFGIPMGFGYWLIPAVFFKIFGPYLFTLIKAQVFINILSGLAFRSIFSSLGVQGGIRCLGVLLFTISFSFFNFWPWYNHTVIVFQFIGLAFLLKGILAENKAWKLVLWLTIAAFFTFLSFFTKQDGGGLALLLCLALLVYHSYIHKSLGRLLIFSAAYLIFALIFILPFLAHDFGYWFNYGQHPHNSRIKVWDFISQILGGSFWEKFYLSALVLFFLLHIKKLRAFIRNEKSFLLFLLTLGILVEALLFQVTSYTPPDNNIFFHAFALVFFINLHSFGQKTINISWFTVASLVLLFWWSGSFWKYAERKIQRHFPQIAQMDEDEISLRTYVIGKPSDEHVGEEQWVFSNLPAFKKIYMPESTVKGIERLQQMDMFSKERPRDVKVLNMTELTPLAHSLGFELEKNRPLWYHKGVGIFQRDIDRYKEDIENDYFDLVLFEVVPYLNNFYPEEIRSSLQEHYDLIDTFLAPRRPTDSTIEVYQKKINAEK